MKMTKPKGFNTGGSALWDDIVAPGRWELRHDELRILEHACRTLDELDRLQAAFATEEVVVEGSVGQHRANPLASEVRRHRELLAKLLKQLDLTELPDDDHVDEHAAMSPRSERARHAAQVRWNRVRDLREGGADV